MLCTCFNLPVNRPLCLGQQPCSCLKHSGSRQNRDHVNHHNFEQWNQPSWVLFPISHHPCALPASLHLLRAMKYAMALPIPLVPANPQAQRSPCAQRGAELPLQSVWCVPLVCSVVWSAQCCQYCWAVRNASCGGTLTAISITFHSFRHWDLKPLERPPVSLCGWWERKCCLEHRGSCLSVLFAVCIGGSNCLMTLILSFVKHFYFKKVFLKYEIYVWSARTLNLENNDHIQLGSVADAKEAITSDLWKRATCAERRTCGAQRHALWSQLIRVVSNIRVCFVRQPVCGTGWVCDAQRERPFAFVAEGGGREKLCPKSSGFLCRRFFVYSPELLVKGEVLSMAVIPIGMETSVKLQFSKWQKVRGRVKTYSGEVWRGSIFAYVKSCCRGTDKLLLRLVLRLRGIRVQAGLLCHVLL